MRAKHLLLCTALLVPVTLLSCDDSGETPTEATDEAALDNPNFSQSSAGEKIKCFSGTQDTEENEGYGPFNGLCQKLSNIKNGANVATFDDNEDPNDSYAGIYPAKSKIKGKLLTRVNEIEFHYAGGPPTGGAPRLSIAIDECLGGYEGTNGAPTCTTDGKYDSFAFIDANGCNKSDPDPYVDNAFVGEVDPGDDDTCLVFHNNVSYPNWEAFVAANSYDRIARDQETFVIIDQPGHYLLYGLQFR